MNAKGMVRATDRGFTCCDCGRELEPNEALACSACDRADLEALRELYAPQADITDLGRLALRVCTVDS